MSNETQDNALSAKKGLVVKFHTGIRESHPLKNRPPRNFWQMVFSEPLSDETVDHLDDFCAILSENHVLEGLISERVRTRKAFRMLAYDGIIPSEQVEVLMTAVGDTPIEGAEMDDDEIFTVPTDTRISVDGARAVALMSEALGGASMTDEQIKILHRALHLTYHWA